MPRNNDLNARPRTRLLDRIQAILDSLQANYKIFYYGILALAAVIGVLMVVSVVAKYLDVKAPLDIIIKNH
jgi:hypothetical protein